MDFKLNLAIILTRKLSLIVSTMKLVFISTMKNDPNFKGKGQIKFFKIKYKGWVQFYHLFLRWKKRDYWDYIEIATCFSNCRSYNLSIKL